MGLSAGLDGTLLRTSLVARFCSLGFYGRAEALSFRKSHIFPIA
jgi:hypothetical protein